MEIKKVFSELGKVVGDAFVNTDESALQSNGRATFKVAHRVLAIVMPKNTREVADIVKLANKHKLSIYPISQGKNWGLGSKVPPKSDSILLDLSRLNKIIRYSDKYAYVSVEPGVSFKQCSDFLKRNNSKYFINVIGGPPTASIIGNVLERGDGIGPYSERLAYVCGFKVVLPDGAVIQTGLNRFESSKSSQLFPYGLGPMFDGMFTQSNFGIVTEMTVWLCRISDSFEFINCYTNDDVSFSQAINEMRQLYLDGVVNAPFYFWNDFKQLATYTNFPWDKVKDVLPLPNNVMNEYKEKFKFGKWNGATGIYVNDLVIKRRVRKLLKKSVGKHMARFRTFNLVKYRLAKLLSKFIGDRFATLKYAIEIWENNPSLGRPSLMTTKSLYWRKRFLPPIEQLKPHADNCGAIWNCCVIPFCGDEILKATSSISEMTLSYGFEPNIALMLSQTGRYIRLFSMIIYDRSVDGEDEKALTCHRALFDMLEERGYTHNRLDILSMNAATGDCNEYSNFYKKIKTSLDPNHVLSEKRYDCSL